MTTPAPNIAALPQRLRPEVASAIRQASTQTGVDFAYLLEKAAVESSFDPQAQAETSSARGLYQFVDRTWLDMLDRHGATHGYPNIAKAITRDADGNPVVANAAAKDYILSLRDNPRISALMAAEFAQDNKLALEHELGRKVDNAELYMAHFLGAGGAGKFISALEVNGAAEAGEVLPDAAKANASVFYDGGRALSLADVFARFEDRFSRRAGPNTAAAAGIPGALPKAAIIAASPIALAAPSGVETAADAHRRTALALRLLTLQAITQPEPEAGGWVA